MRIIIDAHMVGDHETGNESFILGLVKGFLGLQTADELILAASNEEAIRASIQMDKRVRVAGVSSSPFKRLIYELPAMVHEYKADALFCTYASPLWASCKVGVIIHDVSFLRNPSWFSFRDRLVLRGGVGASVRRADVLFTLTEHSKRELVELYGLDPERIHVTLAGPATAPSCQEWRESETAAILSKFHIGGKYLLAVGNLQPRKNLARLVCAFADIVRRGHDIKLVIAGRALWRESEIAYTAKKAGVEANIIFTGYVEEYELIGLYHGAAALVYPSLYEGFGLPVLEAMACGVPCVVSNTSSLPEVAGDAAVYVEPESVDSIRDGILRAMLDDELRETLIKKGYERCGLFRWEKTAERIRNGFSDR